MQTDSNPTGTVADAQSGNWVDRHAPEWLKPYARLARWDRPIGIWLLFWPCAFSLALAAIAAPLHGFNLRHLLLMFIGSAAMRGAGCTFNDIVDTDIDMLVARTRSRPIPSGAVTRRNAAVFMVLQSLVGLVMLLQFNVLTIVMGVLSLVLVAIYPFMKRVTWWPQAFLGLAFSWGALVGWTAEIGNISLAPLLLYAGCIAWTIAYDTIYALQDIEDDALIGVKSTARLFGDRARGAIALFYGLAYVLWVGAGLVAGGGVWFVLASLVAAGFLAWQVLTLDAEQPGNSLVRFKRWRCWWAGPGETPQGRPRLGSASRMGSLEVGKVRLSTEALCMGSYRHNLLTGVNELSCRPARKTAEKIARRQKTL